MRFTNSQERVRFMMFRHEGFDSCLGGARGHSPVRHLPLLLDCCLSLPGGPKVMTTRRCLSLFVISKLCSASQFYPLAPSSSVRTSLYNLKVEQRFRLPLW